MAMNPIAAGIVLLLASCGGPVRDRPSPSGALIAVGGGPGGPQDACFACHGFAGEGEGLTPRLAGLGRGYLAKQLHDYAEGRRPDPVMGPIAERLSDGDRRAVSDYYASRDALRPAALAQPNRLYHQGDTSRGIRACADCHGGAAEGKGSSNPALALQPAAYTAEQLRRWKRSVRRNDARDVMGASARRLTDAEIERLAEYLEQKG